MQRCLENFFAKIKSTFDKYKSPCFTDTNSVICKIYVVGDDAYIVPWADVGIRPYEKRRKIYYEGYWHCQKSG